MEATTAASTTDRRRSPTCSRTRWPATPSTAPSATSRTVPWHDVTYRELDEIVTEIGLGLIDLGIEAGERVSILATTRPDWSYADMGATSAGTVVVPIYPTNSPEECHWVLSTPMPARSSART